MVLFTAIAVLGTLTLIFILFSKWRYTYWTRKGAPQLSPHLVFGDFKPIVNRSIAAQQHFLNIYKYCKAKGWKEVGIYNFLSPEWMTLDLQAVKAILLKDFEHFPGHGVNINVHEPLSKNLFSMEGEEWKKLRAKLTPTFTTGKMKMMFETLAEKANVLKKVVNEVAESGQELHIKEWMARFGTDVIASVAFGIEMNSLEEPDNQFRRIGQKVFEPQLLKFLLTQVLPVSVLHKLGFASVNKEVSTYFTKTVRDTIRYREANKIQRKDFMHLMLQLKNEGYKGEFVTEQEIITEAFVFYLAGFETSSTATTFALLELSRNQHVQDKLRQEIIDVLERHDGKLTYDAIQEMEYLDKVMNEALRKWPPAPVIRRECAKRYKVPGSDVVLEKGTKVYIPTWGLHMDPEYYPNPEVFNPENFSPENKSKRPDFTFLPFGEGPRQCIGLRFGMMQAKVGLITLLSNFKFSPTDRPKWPLEMDKGALVLSVKGDVWLKVNKL